MGTRGKSEKGKSGKKAALIGALTGITAAAALCFIFSVLIANEKLPEDMMKQLLAASCFIAGMSAALIAGRLRKANRLPIGLASAGLLAAVIIVIGLAAGREEALNRGVVITTLAMLAGGATGGIIASMRSKQR